MESWQCWSRYLASWENPWAKDTGGFVSARHHRLFSHSQAGKWLIYTSVVQKNQSLLVGFLTSLPATRLYRGWALRLTFDNFTCCHTETEQRDHNFCLRRSHYRLILTRNQPVGTGRPEGDQIHDHLTMSGALYRLSYRAPGISLSE